MGAVRALALVISTMLLASGEAMAGSLDKLEILQRGYPRAFFFRSSEGMARTGKLEYADWEQTFLRLNGIMGKVLDEEVPNTSTRNIPFFTRFKAAHPEQVVLLHYNGNARDPRDGIQEFFAGHWIYYNGCRVTRDVPAQAGESVIHVEDPSLFMVNMGRYQDKNEDLGICRMEPDGKPDWTVAEQLQLLAVDKAAKTLTVRRGAYGTRPLAFAANQAYIAAHVVEGPWGRNSNLLWFYNHSLSCPKDAKGRTCTDVLVEDLSRRFLPGGELESFDGLEFDVLHHNVGRGGARGADVDADGKADGGMVEGRNVYGIGVYEFCRRLREKLGDQRLILADGAGVNNQRAFGVLNGIESEGWPTLSDWDIVDWSGGLNRHAFWRDNAFAPAFHYVNHKFMDPGSKPHQVPFSISRLVLAACMFTDAAVTYSLVPPAEEGERLGVYDELWCGVEHEPNWLGKPLGPPVRLALSSPDLLRGQGQQLSEASLALLNVQQGEVSFDQRDRTLRIAAGDAEARKLAWRLPDLTVSGPDLLFSLRVRAEPMAGYPETIPRLLWVSCGEPGGLISQSVPQATVAFRGKAEQPLDAASGARLDYRGPTAIAGETHEAYFVHPPYRGGTGYTAWMASVDVPADDPQLVLHTGMTPAPSKSDGVTFKVEVLTDGARIEVLSTHHTELAWRRHVIDLGRWSGRQVRLKFIADAGPADNSVADQAYWGDVRVTARAAAQRPSVAVLPRRIMAWVGQRWFDATFYFRNVPSGLIRLSFEIESAEPVHIAGMSLHEHPDAIVRAFEHGAVLANPSLQDYTFDIARLLPGASYRRFQGSSKQDPAFNDGSNVGDQVVLGPRDAIFLVKKEG